MLTRLRATGFKNLVGLDVRFGPLTCIAGPNGVGKSNLMDAILFLGALAQGTLLDAALSVRDQGAKSGDIRGLFHHAGDRYAEEMSFSVEMIIPEEGEDDLGQKAEASSTFVEYSLRLRFKRDENARTLGSLEIVSEELKHIPMRSAPSHLLFKNSAQWRNRVVVNRRMALAATGVVVAARAGQLRHASPTHQRRIPSARNPGPPRAPAGSGSRSGLHRSGEPFGPVD